MKSLCFPKYLFSDHKVLYSDPTKARTWPLSELLFKIKVSEMMDNSTVTDLKEHCLRLKSCLGHC